MICNYRKCTNTHDVERVFHQQPIHYCAEHDPKVDERVCGFLQLEAEA